MRAFTHRLPRISTEELHVTDTAEMPAAYRVYGAPNPPPNQPGLSESSVREIMIVVWLMITLIFMTIVGAIAFANPGVRLAVTAAFYRWRAGRGTRRVTTCSTSSAAGRSLPSTQVSRCEGVGGAITFGGGAKSSAKPGRARPASSRTYTRAKSSEDEQEPLRATRAEEPSRKPKAGQKVKSKRGATS